MMREADPLDWAMCGLVVVVLVVFGLAIWDSFFRWPNYAHDHHCEKTGRTESRMRINCHRIGKGTSCLQSRRSSSEWACDGGEKVWR